MIPSRAELTDERRDCGSDSCPAMGHLQCLDIWTLSDLALKCCHRVLKDSYDKIINILPYNVPLKKLIPYYILFNNAAFKIIKIMNNNKKFINLDC